MKRSLYWIIALGAAVFACTPAKPIGNKPTASGGNWAIVRLEGDPDLLNPMITNNANAKYVLVGALGSMVSEQLLRYDPKTGKPTEPGLAIAYPEVSDDHREWLGSAHDETRVLLGDHQDHREYGAEDHTLVYKQSVGFL